VCNEQRQPHTLIEEPDMKSITHTTRLTVLATLIAAALTAACSSSQVKPESTDSHSSDSTSLQLNMPVSSTDADTSDTILQAQITSQEPSEKIRVDNQDSTTESVSAVDESRPALLLFTFGFNQAKLDTDNQQIVEQHGRFLAEHPEIKLIINGHADQQGDSRYNDILAQKRAEHVADLLMSQGAMKEQIEILSWGSSAPLADARHNREQRRVELKYVDEYLVHSAVE
jgi:peptidoglycan-associated lipoprotein